MLFKKKKIVVDCYTYLSYVSEFAKIDRGVKFFPQWWRDVPSTHPIGNQFFEMPTIKKCPGFVGLYKKSWIMPLWCDLGVDTRDGVAWHYSDGQSKADLHPEVQLGQFLQPDYQHIKLVSPWRLKCSEEVSFLADSPAYNLPLGVLGAPGIIEFKHQTAANINLFFRREQLYNLPHGTPILSLTALTERPVEFRVHLVGYEEWQNLDLLNTNIKFVGRYNYIKKCLSS